MSFLFIIVLFSSCGSQNKVQNNNMKKVESRSDSKLSYNSTTDVKEVVTDPITMDRCDKKNALEYEGYLFCSQQSINKYKEQKNN
jgi:YHS domain-containing protein